MLKRNEYRLFAGGLALSLLMLPLMRLDAKAQPSQWDVLEIWVSYQGYPIKLALPVKTSSSGVEIISAKIFLYNPKPDVIISDDPPSQEVTNILDRPAISEKGNNRDEQ